MHSISPWNLAGGSGRVWPQHTTPTTFTCYEVVGPATGFCRLSPKTKKTPTPGCVTSQWKSRLETVSDFGFKQSEYDWSRICHHVMTRWFGLTPTWFTAGGPTPLGPEPPVLQPWLVLNMTYFSVTVPTLGCGWSSRTNKRKMKICVNVITWWQMSIEG